jgi:hypothetical protein
MKTIYITFVVLALSISQSFAEVGATKPVDMKMNCKPLKNMEDFEFNRYEQGVWSFKHKTSGVTLAISCNQTAPKDLKKLRESLDKMGSTTQLVEGQYQITSESLGLNTTTFVNIDKVVNQYSFTAKKEQKDDFTKLTASALKELRAWRK